MAAIPHPYVITFFISLVTTALLLPLLIRKMRAAGYVGVDLNKLAKRLPIQKIKELKTKGAAEMPVVARGGGVAMIFGFCVGILLSLWLMPQQQVAVMLTALLSVVLISMIGMFEDFVPVRQAVRMLAPVFAALPLVFMSIGSSAMTLPFLGSVDFGIFYFMLIVPIGVIACSNLFNLLAGFNGLEAGSGAVVAVTLFITAYITNKPEAAFVSMALLAVCLAFLLFNWFPAKIFPGNAGTYLIGGTIAVIAIVGNMERIAIIAVIPQIIEFFLKAASAFKAEVFGTPDSKGRLRYEGPTQSLAHALMKALRPSEKQLVAMLLVIQVAFGLLALGFLYW
jgi:UDP-N-acetylglucosamine--dolichyl-phosphate N-acetylglucosaminephosphotransferase